MRDWKKTSNGGVCNEIVGTGPTARAMSCDRAFLPCNKAGYHSDAKANGSVTCVKLFFTAYNLKPQGPYTLCYLNSATVG
eukprot:2980932-Amphidinium_carterae.2